MGDAGVLDARIAVALIKRARKVITSGAEYMSMPFGIAGEWSKVCLRLNADGGHRDGEQVTVAGFA